MVVEISIWKSIIGLVLVILEEHPTPHTYLLGHDISRLSRVEEMPISKDWIPESALSHVVDNINIEVVIRRLIAYSQEYVGKYPLWVVVG